MALKAIENSELVRWQGFDFCLVLASLADYVEEDASFRLRSSMGGLTRGHASAGGHDFEFLCTGPRFYKQGASSGGGGMIDLAMRLFDLAFKDAVALLRACPG